MRTTWSHFIVRWRVALIPLDWKEIWFKSWMWECELALPNFSSDEIGFDAWDILPLPSGPCWVQCFVTLCGLRNTGLVLHAPAQLEGMPMHDAPAKCNSWSSQITLHLHLQHISQKPHFQKLHITHIKTMRCHIYSAKCWYFCTEMMRWDDQNHSCFSVK